MEMPVSCTSLPLAGVPIYSPWWVARLLQRATTLSPSAIMSSMVLTTSGKPCRKSAASCLAASACSAAKSSCAASRSPVWFQSSSCSLRTRSLFSCADIGLSLPGSPTDHNTACRMPLEDIRCTLTLCPNREAREEAASLLPPSRGPRKLGQRRDRVSTRWSDQTTSPVYSKWSSRDAEERTNALHSLRRNG